MRVPSQLKRGVRAGSKQHTYRIFARSSELWQVVCTDSGTGALVELWEGTPDLVRRIATGYVPSLSRYFGPARGYAAGRIAGASDGDE